MVTRFSTNCTNRTIDRIGEIDVPELAVQIELDRQIKAATVRFNLAVEGLFGPGGLDAMTPLTTPDGLAVMHKKLEGWKTRQVVGLRLVGFQFLAFDVLKNGLLARAFTLERWVFCYADGSESDESESVDRYHMRLIDTEWRVDAVESYSRQPE